MPESNSQSAPESNPKRNTGSLRPGKRRILIAGAHREIAIELITRLLDNPSVDAILAVGHHSCPPALMGHDPNRFSFVTTQLHHRRPVDNLFMLERFRERPLDTVIHLAFARDPKGYDSKRHEYNVNSTRHLLEASLRHDIGKYVFLSSDAVYALGPRSDYKVREDSPLSLDPKAHPTVRDIIDAEFLCRAKMDHPHCEVMVIRPAGILGGGVMSGLNLLFESDPPLLPVGFDPMINPTSKERLVHDLLLASTRRGKGVYNVSGTAAGPLSKFLEERGIQARRLPGMLLRPANRLQRYLGQTRYHAQFQRERLYYSLVLDDSRFERDFREREEAVSPESTS